MSDCTCETCVARQRLALDRERLAEENARLREEVETLRDHVRRTREARTTAGLEVMRELLTSVRGIQALLEELRIEQHVTPGQA